jgi:hypothetical protein
MMCVRVCALSLHFFRAAQTSEFESVASGALVWKARTLRVFCRACHRHLSLTGFLKQIDSVVVTKRCRNVARSGMASFTLGFVVTCKRASSLLV